MKYQHKSRWSRIIFLSLCLSVVETGWVTKTHPFEVAASLVTPQLLYLVGLACSLMQRDSTNSAVDRLFQQEMDRSPHQAPVHENKTTTSACRPQQISHSSVFTKVSPDKPVQTEPIKTVATAHHISPTIVHKMDNVVDKAQAVACHTAHEQVVQAAYHAIPEAAKAASQELVRHVVLDWNKSIERSSQESLRYAQARADNHMLAKLRALNPGVTYETHANGGVTCYAPNPIFSLYLGPARPRPTSSLADAIVARQTQERIQLACDPELRAAVANEFCAFLRNDYCLLYGSLLERIAALLYLVDFHIDVVDFGQPLNAIQKEIYAQYACTDGSICIDRLADMTDAHAIVKKHIAFQKKMASHFEKPCRPVCGVCDNKGKQCEHLRQIRKNNLLIKKKRNVDLDAIRTNPTNQCCRKMLSAFATGNIQQVEQIKNDNSSIKSVQTLYEQIRIAYNKMVEQQETLLKDAYGIWHFKLSASVQDPIYTALSRDDRIHLQNNPSARAHVNDALLMRKRYKDSLHEAWNISQEATPGVHQALYALIDRGTVPERIEKIHGLTNNPALSKKEQKELIDALFLPNGIIKDFVDYERAQTLKMPHAILQQEYSEARKLLNHLVYAERMCDDEQDQIKLENAIASLHYAVTVDHGAELYISYAQEVYKQTVAATMLFNAQQQGNNNQLPPGPNGQPNKNKKNGKPPENKSGPRLQTMTEEQWKKSLKYCSDPNNLNHWFGDNTIKHKFVELLVKMNNDQIAVIEALLAACIGQLPQNGPFKDIPVVVEGFVVCVRGVVMDGIIKFGTIFIK